MIILILAVVMGIAFFILMNEVESTIMSNCYPSCEVLLTGMKMIIFGFIILGLCFGVVDAIINRPQQDNDIARDEPWEKEPPSMPIGNLLKYDSSNQ